jgi:4-amino-4-deoxy-L-arabinose transferase-like glycosyltransferase
VATGLLAALLLALSPFDLLFASTAFTDPLLVALALASAVAAARGRLGMAGLWLGLSVATKQQGLLFLPLVVALGLVATAARNRRNWRAWLLFLLGFGLVLAGIIAWDAARLHRPGFWQQGFISYGDLGHIDLHSLGARAISWLQVLGAFWASPLFGLFLLAGILAWLLSSYAVRAIPRPTTIDWVLMAFVVAMLLLHWLVGFQIWDRYLLGLVPLVALLAARAWVALGRLLPARRWRLLYAALLLLAIGLGLLRPVTLAAQSRVPVGGDHGAYDGIDELAAYLRDQAPAGSVLYHYWLGYHYRFYLHGEALRLHWYPDLADLVHDAYVYRREPRYIAFPSFRDSHEIMAGLEQAGFTLVPVLETERRDGTTSFRLYRLDGPEEQP